MATRDRRQLEELERDEGAAPEPVEASHYAIAVGPLIVGRALSAESSRKQRRPCPNGSGSNVFNRYDRFRCSDSELYVVRAWPSHFGGEQGIEPQKVGPCSDLQLGP